MVKIDRKFSLFATSPIKDSRYLTRSIRQIFETAFKELKDFDNFKDLEKEHIKGLISKKNEVTPLEMKLFSEFYNIVEKKYEGDNLSYQLSRANMRTTGDIYNASAEYIAHYYKKNSEQMQSDSYDILNQMANSRYIN